MPKVTITKTEQAQLKTLVERANKRIQALERKGYTNAPTLKHIEKQLFNNSKFITTQKRVKVNGKYKYVQSTPKYRTDIAKLVKTMDKKAFNSYKKEIEKFLSAKTSTPSGVEKMYSQAYNSFSQQYSGFSFNEFLEFWNNSVTQEAKKIYGSDNLIDLRDKAINSGMTQEQFLQFMQDKNGVPYMQIEDDIDEWYNQNYGLDSEDDTIPWLSN